MQTLEEIKEQYARVLDQKDWVQFKYIADYYFDTAAKLKKRDVNVREELQLLVRNSQKRLFIGIGCEMLLKAIYLKSAYCINKYKNNDLQRNVPSNKLSEIDRSNIDKNKTFTLDPLICHLHAVLEYPIESKSMLERGLRIAMAFRNKEGHVTLPVHEFNIQNYRDVENSIIFLYKVAFSEELNLKISMAHGEEYEFSIRST